MIEISGMWLNESTSGTKYFTGRMGKGRLVMFKNTFKKDGSNEPDYILYVEEQGKEKEKETESDVF